jgi:tetratricopeptide (TPR) repeat protein
MSEQQAVLVSEALKLIVTGGIGGLFACIGNWFVNKKLTIHKLQFEKEFQLYGGLWKALIAVRKTVIITLDIETKDSLSCGGEYEKAIEIFNEAKNLFEDNRPFYHDTVSKITRELLHQCRGYLTEVTKMLKSGKDDEDLYDKADELLKKVPEAINEIEKAIKGRIGLLQKAKIVE